MKLNLKPHQVRKLKHLLYAELLRDDPEGSIFSDDDLNDTLIALDKALEKHYENAR